MLSEAWTSCWVAKKRRVSTSCTTSIKGAQVSIEALTILSEQITVLLRLPKPAASQQAATIFIAVMLDVLSFVHG